MSLGKPVIKGQFMDDEMVAFATQEAVGALSVMPHEQQVASYLKNKFEQKYKSNWHCVVGRNFSAHVTHETGRYIYFYIG